jgi:RecA-family ATPase
MTDVADHLASLIEPVARELLGEPNKQLSSKKELRFGARGSLSVDLGKGTWYDHEANEGGGTLDLVTRGTGRKEQARFEWLEQHGYEVPGRDAPRTNGHTRHDGPKLGPVVAAYDYTDEGGDLLFQVTRHDPKDFRQRSRDQATGEWTWKVKGVRQVPYRLPDLIEAISNEHVVFVVEGEKDADNLWKLGAPATTNAGGTGKWRDALSEFFQGADVVVIQDNDPQKKHPKSGELMFHDDGRPILPGQDHAQDVARSLYPVANSVRVLDLAKHWPSMPPKGDVSDWIKQGGTLEALFDLTEALPTWSPDSQVEPALLTMINIIAWDGVPAPARRWAVRNRIPACNVTLFSGEGGVGKTLLAMQLAVATALGKDWIGEMPEPGPVMFITAEDDEDEIHFRMAKIVQHYGTSFRALGDLHFLSLAGKDAVMAVVDGKGIVRPTPLFTQLQATARAIRPRWIGLDTAADIFVCDERNRTEARQCIGLLRGLCLEIDTAILLLSHPSLSGIASGSGMSGSTAWSNSVRSRLYLKAPNKQQGDEADDEVRVLETMKANYGPIGEPVRLTWKDGLLLPEPAPTSLEKLSQGEKAKTIFLAILERYNRQDIPASATSTARNFAPNIFADEPEAKALHPKRGTRKHLLREAMNHLLAEEDQISQGSGPLSKPPSRRAACLYRVQKR